MDKGKVLSVDMREETTGVIWKSPEQKEKLIYQTWLPDWAWA